MSRRFAAGLMVWLLCHTAIPALANQDALGKARELYLSADYDGALAILDTLDASAVETPIATSVYRVFCLLALDRNDEAQHAIAHIVETDPFYRPSEADAAPRMRTVFNDSRKALLPRVVQRMYADAKADFDKNNPDARARFDRLIALLDDPDLQDVRFADLRAVAAGFRDLSKVSVETADLSAVRLAGANAGGERPDATHDSAPKLDSTPDGVVPKTASPLTGPPDKIRVSTKGASRMVTPKEPPPPGLEPPLVLSQPMPQWSPKGMAALQTYKGLLEITIDAQGNVTTVVLQQAMQPAFDKALIKAAWKWKYRPALLNGAPVLFVKVVEIQIQPNP